jgi:hypothetical protein
MSFKARPAITTPAAENRIWRAAIESQTEVNNTLPTNTASRAASTGRSA